MNRMTILLSATVLAGGVALSGAAYADHADGNALGLGNATGGGSSAASTIGEGNATGGSTSTSTEGQGNATAGSTANTAIGSGNTHTDNINKSASIDNNNTHTFASNNSIDNGNSDSHNDNRTDSHNDNHTINTTTNITTNVSDSSIRTVSDQDLRATVSGISVNVSSDDDPARLRTGDIAGSTYTSFSGIQTASLNTGLASVNQAATSIAAHANVTFGAP
jgi:hypothetical protein